MLFSCCSRAVSHPVLVLFSAVFVLFSCCSGAVSHHVLVLFSCCSCVVLLLFWCCFDAVFVLFSCLKGKKEVEVANGGLQLTGLFERLASAVV